MVLYHFKLENKLLSEMEKAYFKVVGMYCISCKSVVEKQLKNESGIKRIDVDYMTYDRQCYCRVRSFNYNKRRN
jgi:hypothetical protein